MKKMITYSLVAFLLFPAISFAAEIQPYNTVTFELTTQQWVETKTAKVTVQVNATLDEAGLANSHQDISTKLTKISNKGTWHITAFNRSKDESGLEKLTVSAEARLAESELASLRDNATKVSKPGETFTIDSIDFSPSEEEIEQAQESLRQVIYGQAKDELGKLNSYPDDKFFLHTINFAAGPIPRMAPQTESFQAKNLPAGGYSPPMTVSDQLKMTATIIFASAPK